MKIQHMIGNAIVAARQPAKSCPVAVESRQAAIRVITYKASSRMTQISSSICFGVFFFMGNLLVNG